MTTFLVLKSPIRGFELDTAHRKFDLGGLMQPREGTGLMNGIPTIDAIVVAANGEIVGGIKEFEGDCFKIDAPLQPDYWLGPDAVDVSTEHTVILSLNWSDLASVIRPSGKHSGYHMH